MSPTWYKAFVCHLEMSHLASSRAGALCGKLMTLAHLVSSMLVHWLQYSDQTILALRQATSQIFPLVVALALTQHVNGITLQHSCQMYGTLCSRRCTNYPANLSKACQPLTAARCTVLCNLQRDSCHTGVHYITSTLIPGLSLAMVASCLLLRLCNTVQSQRGAAKFSNAFISPLYPAVRSTWPKVGPAEIAASPAAVASAASSRFSPLPLLRIVSLANDSARPDACAIRHTVSCIYLVLSCIKLQALTLC